MNTLCFDLETPRIAEAEENKGPPPMVVMGFSGWVDGVKTFSGALTHMGELIFGDVVSRVSDVAEYIRQLFLWADYIVNHNITFDNAVLAASYPQLVDLIFELSSKNKIHCTMQRERVMDMALGLLGFWCIPRDRGVLIVGASGKKPRTLYPNPKILQSKDYTLQELALVHCGIDLDKETWRLGFGELWGVPWASWPEGARRYVLSDVEAAYQLDCAQRRNANNMGWPDVPTSAEQANAALGLEVQSLAGMRVDGPAVARRIALLESYLGHVELGLKRFGLVRPDGTRDTKLLQSVLLQAEKLIQRNLGPNMRLERTEGGKGTPEQRALKQQVKTSAQALEDLSEMLNQCTESEVPIDVPEKIEDVKKLAETLANEQLSPDARALQAVPLVSWKITLQKMLITYLRPMLKAAQEARPLRGRYTVIVRTARTSMSPNLQNVPKIFQIRECFIPRPGYIFGDVDYSALELHTLAQVCLRWLGFSTLAEVLNQGIDPHSLFAAQRLLHVSYEDVERIRRDKKHPEHKTYKKRRDNAKVANFGLPGGLGAGTFVPYAKGQGVTLTLSEAKEIRNAYFAQWPEMKEYHRYITALLQTDWFDDEIQTAFVTIPGGSNLSRGRARFTEACNFPFQGLAAMGAKHAQFKLAEACYTRRGSLWGSRPLLFVHDQSILEHPIGEAADRIKEQSRIMVDAMAEFIPDVRPKVEAVMSWRWSKDAEPTYDDRGILIPSPLPDEVIL